MNNLNIENILLNYFKDHEIVKQGFLYLLHNNKENFGAYNTGNAYHTLQHCMNVAFNCLNGIKYFDEADDSTKVEAVVLSALFHDADHFGNMKLPDSQNIEAAIKCLGDFLSSYDKPGYNNDKFINLCKHYIQCTEFPHQFDTEPESLSSLIRDADILEMTHNKLLVLCMLFAKELDVDFKTAMENQEKFINNIKFLTAFGRDAFNKNSALILVNMSKINELFNV